MSSTFPAQPVAPEIPPEQLVMRWLAALNARDLDGMLSCVTPDVMFQPLRLHGIDRTYQGHDGIARWHERLIRLDTWYQVEVAALSMPADGTVLATGEMSLCGLTHAAPFWGVQTIKDGLITTARHYLSDTQLAERFAVP